MVFSDQRGPNIAKQISPSSIPTYDFTNCECYVAFTFLPMLRSLIGPVDSYLRPPTQKPVAAPLLGSLAGRPDIAGRGEGALTSREQDVRETPSRTYLRTLLWATRSWLPPQQY